MNCIIPNPISTASGSGKRTCFDYSICNDYLKEKGEGKYVYGKPSCYATKLFSCSGELDKKLDVPAQTDALADSSGVVCRMTGAWLMSSSTLCEQQELEPWLLLFPSQQHAEAPTPSELQQALPRGPQT